MTGRTHPNRSRSTNALAHSLTDQVIPKLRERHGNASAIEPPVERQRVATKGNSDSARDEAVRDNPFTQNVVDDFTLALMANGDAAWREKFGKHINRVRNRRTVRDGLLAPAAAKLGEMWCSDDATMVDVTVATSRLQAALQELPGESRDRDGMGVILLPAPSDTHVFGLFVLADALREDGWRVRVELRPDVRKVDRLLQQGGWDAIGVGLAAERFVDTAIDFARALRKIRRGTGMIPILAGGGGTTSCEETLLSGGFDAVVGPGDDITARLADAIQAVSQRTGRGETDGKRLSQQLTDAI